jgi:hypothetical protein
VCVCVCVCDVRSLTYVSMSFYFPVVKFRSCEDHLWMVIRFVINAMFLV